MGFEKNITLQFTRENMISFTFSDDEGYMGNRMHGIAI